MVAPSFLEAYPFLDDEVVASCPFTAKIQVDLKKATFLEEASFPWAFPSASCLEVALASLPFKEEGKEAIS